MTLSSLSLYSFPKRSVSLESPSAMVAVCHFRNERFSLLHVAVVSNWFAYQAFLDEISLHLGGFVFYSRFHGVELVHDNLQGNIFFYFAALTRSHNLHALSSISLEVWFIRATWRANLTFGHQKGRNRLPKFRTYNW